MVVPLFICQKSDNLYNMFKAYDPTNNGEASKK